MQFHTQTHAHTPQSLLFHTVFELSSAQHMNLHVMDIFGQYLYFKVNMQAPVTSMQLYPMRMHVQATPVLMQVPLVRKRKRARYTLHVACIYRIYSNIL